MSHPEVMLRVADRRKPDIAEGQRSRTRVRAVPGALLVRLCGASGPTGPHVITDADEMIARAHGNRLLHIGHVAVLASCPLLIAIVIHYTGALAGSSAEWAGLIAAGLAVIGTVALAADKGALCLTMSAFDTLPEPQFAQLGPVCGRSMPRPAGCRCCGPSSFCPSVSRSSRWRCWLPMRFRSGRASRCSPAACC